MEVRTFTVGPVQENCYLVWRQGSDRALLIDPGEESPKLLDAIHELKLELEAILITHCHFDHIGAVAPIAKATGASVYVSAVERPVLADIMSYVPQPHGGFGPFDEGFGPFEDYEADRTLTGGEQMTDAEFEQAGGNRSAAHVDFMIGSGHLDVDGVSADGTAEPLMRQGEWVP